MALERSVISAWVFAWLAVVTPASAQQAHRQAEPITDWQLAWYVQTVADATGQRFILDPRVRGTDRIEADTRQSSAQILRSLEVVMRARGFLTQPAGNYIRIEPAGAGPTDEPDVVVSSRPVRPGANLFGGGRFVPVDLSRAIRLQAERVGGVQRGYRVYPASDGVEFARVGFDVGDLVISVNGRALDDAGHGEQVFQEALRERQLTVRLERANRSEHLSLPRHLVMVEDPPPPLGFGFGMRTENDPLFGEQGLMEQDLIIAINDAPITEVSAGVEEFLRLLQSSRPFRVQVWREHKAIELTLPPRLQLPNQAVR